LSTALAISKKEIDLFEALRKLKTDRARLELIRVLHKEGSTKASVILVATLEKSQDFMNLGEAADAALKLGAVDRARDLLINAAERAIAKGLMNALHYIKRLMVLDRNVALDLFKDFEESIRKKSLSMGYTWHCYYDPLPYSAEEILGDSKLAAKYRRRALREALSEEFLTAEEILQVIALMKELGAEERAKLFAAEYIDEIIYQDRAHLRTQTRSRIDRFDVRTNLFDTEQHDEEILKIHVEAGLGKLLLKAFLKWASILERARLREVKGKKMISSEKLLSLAARLAHLIGEDGLSKRIYLRAARKFESQRRFFAAREYYEKAGRLDRKTDERLATKELRHLIPRLGTKTAIDYSDFWNTTVYLASRDKTGREPLHIIEPDLAYSVGLETDTSKVVECSKKITDEKLRRRLLAKAVRCLRTQKLYNYAARVAEEMNNSEAKALWARASVQYEDDMHANVENQLGMLRGAMIYAKLAGDSARHSRLLAFFIERLRNSQREDISLYKDAAHNISSEFFEAHRPLCTHVIEYLKNKEEYIQVERLLLKVEIVDRKVLEEALIQLESTRAYSEATIVAKGLGDETLAKVYSFIQNPDSGEIFLA